MLLAARDSLQKIVGTMIYGVAAGGTFNWVTYALNPEQSYGYPVRLHIALVGSILLGIGCILSTFTSRYGVIVGCVGAAVSWIYFAPLAWFQSSYEFRLLFNIDLPWIIRNNLVAVSKVAAILLLVLATAYSVSRLWRWRP